jgi:hypothetical protein
MNFFYFSQKSNRNRTFFAIPKLPGLHVLSLIFTLVVFLPGCIFIDSVDQPQKVNAGQISVFNIHARIQATKSTASTRFVFAYLVPKNWEGIDDTITYTSNKGSGKMERIPFTAIAKGTQVNWSQAILNNFGIGPNTVPDMKWVAYWTQKTYSVRKNEPDIIGVIKLQVRAGSTNDKFRMGYFIGSSSDGFVAPAPTTSAFSEIINVQKGRGTTIDYCSPRFISIVPFINKGNDEITISINGNYKRGPLSNAALLFLNSKAYTNDNECINVDSHTNDSKLIPVKNNQWYIKLLPSKFYHLHPGQKIKKIEFFIVDKNGTNMIDAHQQNQLIYKF